VAEVNCEATGIDVPLSRTTEENQVIACASYGTYPLVFCLTAWDRQVG
jgi:hypothetical protein